MNSSVTKFDIDKKMIVFDNKLWFMIHHKKIFKKVSIFCLTLYGGCGSIELVKHKLWGLTTKTNTISCVVFHEHFL